MVDEIPSAVWFELTGGTWSPKITPRLVSVESAAFVWHPNGRKSAKRTNSSVFHKTFDEAKDEALKLLASAIESHEAQIIELREKQNKISRLKREDVIK